MASVKNRTRSAAGQATHDAMMTDIDLVVAGGNSRFPDCTLFVASDVVTPETIARAHAAAQAVVIVDEHGNERFLPVP